MVEKINTDDRMLNQESEILGLANIEIIAEFILTRLLCPQGLPVALKVYIPLKSM